MTPLKKHRVVMRIRAVRNNLHKFESDLLKLLAHPDASQEQVDDCRQKYLDLQARVKEVNALLSAEPDLWVHGKPTKI